jgi:beta-barrel assembly-enhancing protease
VRRRNRGQHLARVGTILAIVLLVLAVSLPLWSGLIARFLPRGIQVSIGDSLIGSLPPTDFCRGDEGLAALDDVVRKLAAAAKTDEEFRVYVFDAPVLNAFAAPGGRIVLFRAVIEEAEDPQEVAGVLAHEMAHVLERHPSQAVVQTLGYGIFGLLNPGADSVGSEATQAIMTNHYSRNDELDADRVGVALLNAAGYDSRGLTSFFARLDAQGESIPGALEFLSTHPTGDRRRAAVEALVREGAPTMEAEAWKALRSVCEDKGAPRATMDAKR